MNRTVPEMLALAATHVDAGEFAQAEVICRELLAADPRNPHVLHVQGVAARKQARYVEASELFQKSLAIEPRNFAVEFELGVVLIEQKQWSEALAHFRRALELNPDYQAACVNIATLLERTDQVEEALPWAHRAAEMKPDCAIARFNLGNTLQAVGRVDEAIREFDEALRLTPDFENARWNASLARLLSGDFAAGWPMYEARQAAGKVAIDGYPQPRWQGEPLQGKTILVHAEQGIGDEILFASCFPDLIATAGKVVVVCDPRLEQLFARSFPTACIHGIARRKDGAPAELAQRIDYQIPAGSLPGFFRRSRAEFPRRWRFLHVDAAQREGWRTRYDELGPGLKVGISWRAGGQPSERRKRTTTLAQWLPVLEQHGVRFVNLQYGDVNDQLEAARRDLGITIHDFADGDPLRDMDAFAARISALDLVISVGNATVHLAGALGVPAWSILPLVPAWRWMLGGEQSLWYPSVRLFRQPERRNWSPVFESVAAALASRTGRTGAPRNRLAEHACHDVETPGQVLTLSDVTDTFASAVEAYHRNDYSQAEQVCLQILAHAPRDAKALHLRGLIARATGRLELAIKSIGLAIQVYGNDPQMHLHLAGALIEGGRLDEAIASYQRAIGLSPGVWALHFDLGSLLRTAGRREEAEQSLAQAIAIDPSNAKAYNALAGIQMEMLRWTDAEQTLRKALALKPDYMAAFNNLGQCLHFQGRLNEAAEQFRIAVKMDGACQQAVENLRAVEGELAREHRGGNPPGETVDSLVAQAARLYNEDRVDEAAAIAEQLLAVDENNVTALRVLGVAARQAADPGRSRELLERALAKKPDDYAIHFELGVTLAELRQTREALAHFQRVVQLRPTFHPACVNISAICEEQERYDEVVEWTGKALALKPDCALSYYNLANALRELGRIEEALDAYQRSRELNPKYIKADWNLGLSHLLLGDYQRGWPMFELRIDLREVAVDDYPQPRWDGASLAGKSILIHAEQGIGDEVLFASCFDEVISQARQCVIVCEPRLESLFRRSFPRATVYGYQRRKDCIGLKLKETFDVQIPAGSLPRFLRQTKADFPARDSFLQVDDRLLGFWRDRLAALGPGLKVGISWRAGGKPQERRKRMIPLELWRATLSTPDVQFVNLQYGDSSDEVAQIGRELGITIHDWEEGDPLVDMDSFAAKIKALDLVISVGNATVHIAGAVGTEAWTLLPMVPSWRWMVRGEQSPWYSAVRLFRQPKRGDWPSVMETIARRLRARVGTEIEPALATRQAADVSDDEYWYQANEVNTDAMIESIGVSLAEAERLVAAGELEAAEERYREVLQIAPRHYQALHGMGVVARLTGRSELAIRSFQRSLAMVEGVAVHQSNYAAALADAGREEEAVKAYSRALEIDPAISAARIELGLVLQKLGQHQQALVEFGKASLPGAEDAALLVYRGISLASQCRIDEAIECFEQSLRLNPSHVPALAALADVYLEDQQYEDAERCLRRAIAIRSDVPTWHLLLGRVLRREGEIGSALHSVEQAAELAPGDAAVLGELGAIYREAGEPELAAETLTRATEIEPENGELLTSLGLSLADGGKFAQAILCYDQALKLRPDYAAAHVNRAFALLSQGNLPDGWQEYEWRTKTSNAPRGRAWQIPAWRGESLDERSILVCGEQGVGEEILFASCYRDLLTRARQVVIVCQPRLEQLFRRSFPQATVLPVTRGQETTWRMPAGVHVDFQIAAGSLPTQLRGDRSCFDGARYLEASKAKISHWLARFAMLGDDLKVGVSWRTNGGPLDDPARGNLLDDWLPLLKTPGVQFVSLQPGDVRDELQQLALNHGVVVHHWNDADNTADLDGLAARMAALDLVISADGANLHLAGSLGVPAWALLPHVAGWHWLPVGEHDHRSLWYRSVRMFRQCRLGDWGELFGRAATELLNRARSKVEDSKKSPVAAPHVNLGGSGSPVFGSSPAGGLENS